ncbi:hypothetical protein TNCV_2891161 [Trichonephila clavipes]|nr:hypothetical protein TNCV_2891161 [Trichonephila clavipes]
MSAATVEPPNKDSKDGEKEPMLNHNRDETPAPPPVRNRRQSAIDRAARLVDIHHTVVHVSTEIAVAVRPASIETESLKYNDLGLASETP